jgi:hypothetical protein
MSNLSPIPAKFCYSQDEFHALGGPCIATQNALAAAGKLTFVKQGRSTRILHAEVVRYFASLAVRDDTTKTQTGPANRARRRCAA